MVETLLSSQEAVQEHAGTLFCPYPRTCTASFRDRVFARYPTLAGNGDGARFHRQMMQYCLFAPRVYYGEEAEIATPYRTVAVLAGVAHDSESFAAIRWLEQFDEHVLPLNITDYRFKAGRARAIRPQICPTILSARDSELVPCLKDKQERVYFVDGAPVTRRRQREVRQEYMLRLLERVEANRLDHPARPLLDYLHQQPPDALARVLKANWPTLRSAALQMPTQDAGQRQSRDAAWRVLKTLEEHRGMFYADAENTLRIHALGATVNQLPRELRKLALAGCTSLDLRSSQLAVVARLWGVSSLQVFLQKNLQGGPSIWAELYDHLGVGPEAKPILKTQLYALAYGRSVNWMTSRLEKGEKGDSGISRTQARRLPEHPIIRDLLESREAAYRVIERDGGARDAFGGWISMDGRETRQVAAQQAQSYELRVMLAVLPVLLAEDDIRVLSWLHDGVTIRIGDPREKRRKVERLKDAVRDQAEEMGLATEIEVEER